VVWVPGGCGLDAAHGELVTVAAATSVAPVAAAPGGVA